MTFETETKPQEGRRARRPNATTLLREAHDQAPTLDGAAADPTPAETIDWDAATAAAISLAEADLERFEAEQAETLKALKAAEKSEAATRVAQAEALGATFSTVRTLIEKPALLMALAEKRDVQFNAATLKSPCLPALKVLRPDADNKTLSQDAQALNFALASGWSPEELQAAALAHGKVALVKAERKRRRGETPAPAGFDEEVIEAFKAERRSSALEELDIPHDVPGALVIVCREGEEFRAYAVDPDAKRVMSAVRDARRTHLDLDGERAPGRKTQSRRAPKPDTAQTGEKTEVYYRTLLDEDLIRSTREAYARR